MSEEPNENTHQDSAATPADPANTPPSARWPAPPTPSAESVLERLGTPPFPRGRFPFLGILASVYEQIHDRTSK